MKLRIASLGLLALCLVMVALPAMADSTLYDNGPQNGNTDAWTINFGFSVSNSFHCCKPGIDGGNLGSIAFAAWLFPGDTVSNVEVQVGTSAFGNDLFDGVVSLTRSDCSTNGFGFNVCTESGTFSGPSLGIGDYWLTLSNANVPNGDPVYWDENSGIGCTSPGCPSQAQENTVGTIPSEAFTLDGTTETTTTTTTGTAPEPSSILLFGSGILGLAGIVRRRFLG